MVLNIPIKLYYNDDGTMYLNGALNKVPYVMKLSNLTYTVDLVVPYSNNNYSFQAFFQKADNTTTNGYPMAFVETETVDEQVWYVYEMTIESAILNCSTYGLENKLGIGFYITDGNTTPQTLNTEPFWVKCTYAITGGQNEIEETPLEQLQRTLDLALSTKANIADVVLKIKNSAELSQQEASDTNVGYVYIISQDIPSTYDKGTILVKNSNHTFTIIGYAKTQIDTLIDNTISKITLGYTEVD